MRQFLPPPKRWGYPCCKLIDEIIPLSIVNIYGTIGLTNYGYLDKEKVGIIKELDNKEGKRVNTFLDDLVAAIAAAAASRIAHSMPN